MSTSPRLSVRQAAVERWGGHISPDAVIRAAKACTVGQWLGRSLWLSTEDLEAIERYWNEKRRALALRKKRSVFTRAQDDRRIRLVRENARRAGL